MTPATPLTPALPTRLAILVAAVALLTGCAPDPVPTPTPTAAFASEEEAFAAAEATYRAYNDALNSVDLSDPATFDAAFALSSGNFNASDRRTLSKLHADGDSMVGSVTVSKFVGVNSAPPFREVVAYACVDVSASDVLNSSGASVVDPARPDMNSLRVTFILSGDQLLIDHAARDENAECPA
ncbi:hypothetical protein [Microbacterium sp. J1-1]|uniref:hypothetical protein n=1 Tax=Microbacterium sp. J1-1 TaxID=2992441 RepID=UPI002115AA0F|nr:hypothetical protein [Microbacterium sp. J1-1]UUE19225.1 hypothetical protein LRQ07_10395 [Microbacterium sp. J1-1]